MNVETCRKLNDGFRRSSADCRIFTKGVFQSFKKDDFAHVGWMVKKFEDYRAHSFTDDEHAYGTFEYKDVTVFWKIDYYDSSGRYRSEDPSISEITRRVLTIGTLATVHPRRNHTPQSSE